jgi:tetratricopeptide (TPR) repeat protein
LYAERVNLASARRAAGIWRAAVNRGGPAAFEPAWKLARADYWIGGHAPDAERRAIYEDGIAAARTAASLQPNRPEGHFWLAANMGALAESFGLRAGIKYRRSIRDALETVLRLDPGFLQGSADRALGRWYYRVPSLFGGSHKRAEEHLRASLKYDRASTASHFFLAELYADDGRKVESRAELQAVIDAPVTTEWEPEDREFKEKAARMLANKK